MTSTPETYRMMLAQLDAVGINPADLAAFASGALEAAPGAVTVRSFVTERVLPALTKGTRGVQCSYLEFVVDGYPKLCLCFCDACLDAYRGDSDYRPCPCVTTGRCNCSRNDLAFGGAATGSCLEHCCGFGDRHLASLRLADWEALGRWAQMRAQKRTAVRNRRRGSKGQPQLTHDGRSALEHLRGAASQMYRLAIGDEIRGVARNIALEMKLKGRPKPVARAYDAGQVEELWAAVFSGGDDPELDMIIVWFLIETGSRRGGPIKVTIGDLLLDACKIRLGEKDNKYTDQPISPRLRDMLLSHALRRGDVVIANPDGLAVTDITAADVISRRVVLHTNAAVVYYRPQRLADGTLAPHPLSRRRFETLWGRLRSEPPWLEEQQGRPHDLRKTTGTFIERAFGYAVAEKWLRHEVDTTTGTYVIATDAEVEQAHRWLTGETG